MLSVMLERKMTLAIPSPEVRLAEPADLPQIAKFLIPLGDELFGDGFPGKTPQDLYRSWKYLDNPLGDAIVGIATVSGSVVSVVSASAKRVWLLGKAVQAHELGDFLTHATYRKRGLFSQLIELVCGEARARGSLLAYVRPNELSFPILAGKLLFREVQRIDARRFVIPSYVLSRKTGIPASLIRFSGVDRLFKSCYIPRSPGDTVTVVPVERFGTETDEFWKKASAGYDFALVRDSSSLNWRFSDCPTPYKIWLAYRDDEMVGFLVTLANRTAATATIVDFFTGSRDTEAARALLATGVNALIISGIQRINAWTLQECAPSVAHELLRRTLPIRGKQHLHLAFRVLQPLEMILPAPSQRWYFALGDCDGI